MARSSSPFVKVPLNVLTRHYQILSIMSMQKNTTVPEFISRILEETTRGWKPPTVGVCAYPTCTEPSGDNQFCDKHRAGTTPSLPFPSPSEG